LQLLGHRRNEAIEHAHLFFQLLALPLALALGDQSLNGVPR
jgi:hypothetical protein